jgi:chemotaxis protein methyltransferase CheR
VTAPHGDEAGTLLAVAQVLAEEAGLSLAGGLRAALRDALAAASGARGEEPDALAGRVIDRDPEAIAALVEHAAVPETAFWRHPEQLPALRAIAAAREGPLRIWSAGCATGEEPYTLALLLLEAGRAGRGDLVVATDVSRRVLAWARIGRSAPPILQKSPPELRKLPPDALEAALEPPGPDGVRRIRPALRALVSFAPHNLVHDPPPAEAPFDVVVCRNVLIYFEPAVAAAVLHRLAGALKPDGVLVLGPVELPLAAGAPLRVGSLAGATVLRRP